MVSARILTFLFSYLTWKETKLALLSFSDSDIKKLMASAFSGKYRKVTKICCQSLKVKKVMSRSNLVLHKFKLSHFIK